MLGVLAKFRGLDAGLGGLKGLIRVVRTRSSVLEQRGGGIGSYSLACFSAAFLAFCASFSRFFSSLFDGPFSSPSADSTVL